MKKPIKEVDVARISNPFVTPGAYLDGLLEAIKILTPYLTPTEFKKLITEKLFLYDRNAKQEKYYQFACELTVCAYFAHHFPDTFIYEKQVNPPKDVDCSFTDGGIQFNVEVKCADFSAAHSIQDEDAFRLGFLGRVQGHAELFDWLKPIMEDGPEGKPLLLQKHLDCRLKQYLTDAHDKFANMPSGNELNVLVVCGDDPLDLNKWESYLVGQEGLFTEASFADRAAYSRVDLVLLTNLYHRHHNVSVKNKINWHWELGEAFNVFFDNPASQSKRDLMYQFSDYVPNFDSELIAFDHRITDINKAFKIPFFVFYEQWAKTVFYFQPPVAAVGAAL